MADIDGEPRKKEGVAGGDFTMEKNRWEERGQEGGIGCRKLVELGCFAEVRCAREFLRG